TPVRLPPHRGVCARAGRRRAARQGIIRIRRHTRCRCPIGGSGPATSERTGDAVSLVKSVEVPRRPGSRLEPAVGGPRYLRLVEAADEFRRLLAGRCVWNVNSTATGGGVAEMLQVLVGYVKDLGIPIGWLVITGDAEFFAITKRLHNQIHGDRAGGPLSAAAAPQHTPMLTAYGEEIVCPSHAGGIDRPPA